MSLLSRPPATQPALARPTWVRWQIIGFVMMFIFLGHINRISLSVAADIGMMKDYHISPERVGFLGTMMLAVYSLCMIPGGLMIDRFGVRRALGWLGCGLTLGAVATIALGVAFGSHTSEFSWAFYGSLLMTRIVMGIAAAPMHPSGAHAVAHWIPPRAQTLANGLVTGMCPLGLATANVVLAAMIERFDWPMAFLIMAAATITLTIAWLAYAADRPEHHHRVNEAEIGLIRTGRPVEVETELEKDLEELEHEMVAASLPYEQTRSARKPLWRDWNLVVLTISYSLNNYLQYVFFYWLHYYFYNHLGLGKTDPTTAGIYSGVPFLTMAAGMPLGGLISDWLQPRIGRFRSRFVVAVNGMVCSTLFLFLGLAAEQPGWAAIWFALSVGALGTAEAAFWVTVTDAAQERSGAASAFLNTGGNGVGLLAPWVTPLVAGLFHNNFKYGLAVGGIACFVGATLWFFLRPPDETHIQPKGVVAA